MNSPAFQAAKSTLIWTIIAILALALGSAFGSLLGATLIYLSKIITLREIAISASGFFIGAMYIMFYRYYKHKAFFKAQSSKKRYTSVQSI